MTTVELEGRVVGSQLQLHPAARQVPGVSVRDNEIAEAQAFRRQAMANFYEKAGPAGR